LQFNSEYGRLYNNGYGRGGRYYGSSYNYGW